MINAYALPTQPKTKTLFANATKDLWKKMAYASYQNHAARWDHLMPKAGNAYVLSMRYKTQKQADATNAKKIIPVLPNQMPVYHLLVIRMILCVIWELGMMTTQYADVSQVHI